MAAPNYLHELVFAFLFAVLKAYVDERELGVILGSRSGVQLDIFSAPQPDILFIRKDRQHIIHPQEIVEPPDAIMEIIFSDSSRHRAMARMLRYEEFKVPEFWYIDVPRRLLRVCRLDRSGEYQAAFEGSQGVAKSKSIRGFAIRAQWLWSEPGKFPTVFSVVKQLLAGKIGK